MFLRSHAQDIYGPNYYVKYRVPLSHNLAKIHEFFPKHVNVSIDYSVLYLPYMIIVDLSLVICHIQLHIHVPGIFLIFQPFWFLYFKYQQAYAGYDSSGIHRRCHDLRTVPLASHRNLKFHTGDGPICLS